MTTAQALSLQAPLPQTPMMPEAPPFEITIDLSTVAAPQVVWFDQATGELTGTYPQTLDVAATYAACRAAYDALLAPRQAAWAAQISAWQAACTALLAKNEAAVPPVSTLETDYPAAPVMPAAPAIPAWEASAVRIFDAAHMTTVAPPALQPGFRPVYNLQAGTWSQVEDHRNLPLWDANGNPLPHLIALGPLPTGAMLAPPPPTAALVSAELAAAKAQALGGVIAMANTLSSAVTAAYPHAEQQTWPDQLVEATAYLANNATSTPLLDALIAAFAANGVPTPAQIAAVTASQRTTLANGILAKSAALRTISVAIITLRSAAQAAIAAAPDQATLAATVTGLDAQAAAAKTALGL